MRLRLLLDRLVELPLAEARELVSWDAVHPIDLWRAIRALERTRVPAPAVLREGHVVAGAAGLAAAVQLEQARIPVIDLSDLGAQSAQVAAELADALTAGGAWELGPTGRELAALAAGVERCSWTRSELDQLAAEARATRARARWVG